MQTAFCLAEGVITLTAHPHPQKSAQTFIQQRRARKGELKGEKWASQLRTPFPLVTLPTQQCPRKGKCNSCQSHPGSPVERHSSTPRFHPETAVSVLQEIPGFIELPGYIPIENRHAGLYIRYQPDKRKIKCKHGKNNPRHKAEQHLQVLP